ncbi:MAG TPA: alpha/beta hydrolase-fold protein [Balneolales bacterium]|nr:alpha/beta hydrolase-fold protein [Balneolales bacterium]
MSKLFKFAHLLFVQFIGITLIIGLFSGFINPANAQDSPESFTISFPQAVHKKPITGRMFVFISKTDKKQPRMQAGSWFNSVPFYGVDVHQLKPNHHVFITDTTLGFPVTHLDQIPAGTYYVQALLNVYTKFHRSDGHVIWAHMDHWEGQHFQISPGNLISKVKKVQLNPRNGYSIHLKLVKKIPPINMPPNTDWVKHIKIQSQRLTEFWGHPMYLGATVLLPKGYKSHPNTHYPVVYLQGHFNLHAPYGFSAHKPKNNYHYRYHRETGYQFYKEWTADHFPRMIVVTFQHPTPYFDDSYAVNSANNGPYGDAIMKELIPYVERHFRIIRKPYARVLTGGSTGGWESLALQVYHPKFFGGTWTLYPDPVDFRDYDTINIYKDNNAFYAPGYGWMKPTRYIMRLSNGQPYISEKQFSQLEAVLGTHGRSCQQLEAWDAVFGPVGRNGYPKPLWNKRTGVINHSVAEYYKHNNYDLRYYLKKNWQEIGPDLVGKIHLFVGDMDNYYLNLAVYRLQDFLKNTKHPYYDGSFSYGRPEKGHGWQPVSNAGMLKMMARHIKKKAPSGSDISQWNY